MTLELQLSYKYRGLRIMVVIEISASLKYWFHRIMFYRNNNVLGIKA